MKKKYVYLWADGVYLTARMADKQCLLVLKDKDELLAFYSFPAEHWVHIRTTNPIESTFATVRLRTAKTKGCLSRQTALTMTLQESNSLMELHKINPLTKSPLDS